MDDFNNDYNKFEDPDYEMRRYQNPYQRYEGYKSDDTEFSTDFLSNNVNEHDATSGAIIAGIVGIISSLVALFMYQVVLGIAGIALGGFSVSKGNKTMGYLSIGIGVLALITPILFGGSIISLF